ncbi:MAG: WYL domain-containing protein [Fusobacteriaceae bacterium]|nr:WYL domain-containing protein [Fusobacteriaceae bacterium]
MENKIKVYVEEHIYEQLEKDSIDFDLKKNTLLNRIIKELWDKITIKSTFSKTNDNKSLVFNLNKENTIFSDWTNIIKIQNYETKADFFRDIIYTYIFMSPKMRAEVIFRENKNTIEFAIKNKQICKVWFNNEVRTIEPYLLEINPDDKFYYLVAYDYKAKDLRCFKLYGIKDIKITEEKFEFFKEYREKIEGIRKNFDPFLSYGHILKVRFTEKGIDKFEKSPHNRPKLIEKNGNIYTFYCKEFNALIYFPPFFDEVEILEPLELREILFNKLEKIFKFYS